jgi:hypothetical protein
MENLLSKTPYKFKNSYGGTPEPHTPRMHPGCADPLLKYFSCNFFLQDSYMYPGILYNY